MHAHLRTAVSVAVALAFASAAAALIGSAGTGSILLYEKQRHEAMHAEATGLIDRISKGTMSALRTAEESVEPVCSTKSLTALRRLALASEVIAEFGVRGPGEALICTTTEGRLEQPSTPAHEDIIIVRKGLILGLSFNKQVIFPGPALMTSTIASTPKFTAVVIPALIKQLHSSGVTNVRMLRPGGGSIPILSDGSAKPWIEQLADAKSPATYSRWRSDVSGLLISSRVADSEIIAQSVLPATELLSEHSTLLLVLLCIDLVAAAAVFSWVYPRVRTRFEFQSRVMRLLVPANVICMLQPIVRLDSGEVIGCELLMRLADGSAIHQPGDVIPAVMQAKGTDLFDAVVSERASRDLLSLNLPSGFKVAVNFFPGTMKSGLARLLLDRHFRLLKSKGILVAVEVIEEEMNHEIEDRIRELEFDGYQVSLDDFGTGYSNLASVRNLAPNYLKIDRSFVRDMLGSTGRSTLIPEIIQIARAINAQVVAEGIETADQARLLRDLGAEFGQGYFFGRPMSLANFKDYLAEHLATRESANVMPALLFNAASEPRRAKVS